MKRINSILFAFLAVALAGACTAFVAARVVDLTLDANNRIVFQADDNIFFKAKVTAYFVNDDSPYVWVDEIDHSGTQSQDTSKNSMLLPSKDLIFTTEKRVLAFLVHVENYTEDTAIKVRIIPNEQNQNFLRQTLTHPDGQIVGGWTLGTEEAPACSIELRTELIEIRHSFYLDNSFTIELTAE